MRVSAMKEYEDTITRDEIERYQFAIFNYLLYFMSSRQG
jgi:hypothetical protein